MSDFRISRLGFFGFLADGRKGIYIHRFDDGTYYVGKSVDMANRYIQHLHEYRREYDFVGSTVAYAWFAALPADSTAEELDEFETRAITWSVSPVEVHWSVPVCVSIV